MTFKSLYNSFTLQDFITLLEEGSGFTIADLSKNAPSERNKKFLKIRQEEGRSGSQLSAVVWDDKEDTLMLIFETIPTYDNSVEVVSKKEKVSQGEEYIVRLMFEEISKFLGNKDSFLDKSPKEQIKLVRKMIKVGTVKIDSNDMSWMMQGTWKNASDLGFSIVPFPEGIPDKGIWRKRHGDSEFYLTKHILETVRTIPFQADTIAKMIREKYNREE